MNDASIAVPCTVNGEEVTLEGHPMTRLLDALRRQLRLTGTKEGCGEGECGACSVLIDGELVNSCLVPLVHADGASIRTIEGLGQSGELDRVQQAFVAYGGAQCGICTPGMILAAVTLLERHPEPTDEQIRTGLAGNLCRCTGYMRIFEAVKAAATTNREPRTASREPRAASPEPRSRIRNANVRSYRRRLRRGRRRGAGEDDDLPARHAQEGAGRIDGVHGGKTGDSQGSRRAPL
jgi:carbon-monoxide dehydrogenase small subunit